MFSGGTYDEVARWLENFLRSHAKRVDPRVEIEFACGDEREGKSYAARLRLGAHVTPPLEFEFSEVAGERGSLAWCQALAERVRAFARDHLLAAPATAPR